MKIGTGPEPAARSRQRLTGSDQQEAFFEAVTESDGTLVAAERPGRTDASPFATDVRDVGIVLTARAGTGKSTSILEAMHRYLEANPGDRVSYLAFNKSIADEFRPRMPAGQTCCTMHSLGASILRSRYPNANLDKTKTSRLLWEARPNLARDRRFVAACVAAVSTLKSRGVNAKLTPGDAKRILRDANADPNRAEDLVEIADRLVAESVKRLRQFYDFDDMIFGPVAAELAFPTTDYLFIDEAQDLSPIQQAFALLYGADGRIAVVGDDRQAIYAWRGASSRSLRDMEEGIWSSDRGSLRLSLTRTRRCPRAVVELCREIVPDFEAFQEAPEGEVVLGGGAIEPGDLVLSRVNAPLLKKALEIGETGKSVAILGSDLRTALVAFVRECPAHLSEEVVLAARRKYAAAASAAKEDDADHEYLAELSDLVDCVAMLAKQAPSVDGMLAAADLLFVPVAAAERRKFVLFSTVHRAKGSEAETVHVLEPARLDPRPGTDADEQEENLAYVAATRAKRRLIFHGDLPEIYRRTNA